MQTAIGGDYGSVVIRKRGNDRLFSLGRAGGERHATIILLDNRIAVDCACFPHANSSLAGDAIFYHAPSKGFSQQPFRLISQAHGS